MDFKELLSLAKDNQSFALKKHQRDSLDKSKSKKSGVSDSAIKSFMAKKKQIEEKRKAAEEAERRKRIQARLDASNNKKTAANGTASDSAKNGKLKNGQKVETKSIKPKIKSEQKSTSNNSNTTKQGAVSAPRFQIPKKKADESVGKVVTGKNKDVNADMGSSMKSSATVDSMNNNFKQHRRRKGKEDFEWSGSALSNEIRNSLKSKTSESKRSNLKKSSNAPSFQEIMNIAKLQKDKPTSVPTKKPTVDGGKLKHDDLSELKEAPMKPLTNSIESNSKKLDYKSESKSQRPRKVPGHDSVKAQRPRPNKCTVTTHTIDVRNNYEMTNGLKSSQFRDFKAPMGINQFRADLSGDSKRPNIGSKRHKMTIDDELEQERLQLERKRDLLRMKMQGGKGNYDYYDDDDDADDYGNDLDDFIDDEGDDVDYSRHIRKIFGYDRRQFCDEEDDLRGMESNFSQIAAEEARSARIARLEDEIERRKEEMENRELKRIKK